MAILPCRAKTGPDRHSGWGWTLIFSLSILLISDPGPVSGEKYDSGIVIPESDHQVLQALKHEFIDLRSVLRSWNGSGVAACSGWAGIKCAGGQVIAIQLPWKGLGGRISEKIGQLQGLRRISLHDNVLTGPVPAALGFLPNLRGVYLFNNRLSGSIPATIGNCFVLQTIDLSKNQLTGIIPAGMANSTRLYRVNLSFNALSGPVPVSLCTSHSITFLDLRRNNLSGAVPAAWGRNSSLISISLDHNFLSGTIPDSLSNLTSLNSLDFSNNNLEGNIPESLIKLQNLTTFNVSYNNLSGAVPPALARKFNSTAFVGNSRLCGYSGDTQCQPPPPPPPPPPAENHSHRKLSTKDIILITAGILLIILLILCCVLVCCLIRKRAAASSKNGKAAIDRAAKPWATSAVVEVESGGDAGGKLVHFDGPFVFTADDLLCATAEIMGKSSYGTVYKATLEENNNQVLVKRLREKIAKGQKEFEAEVVELGRIRHPNILALRAYYLGPKGEKLLVYDYMPNGSLASFLHARGPETIIPWHTRIGIAVGISRGLCYLHNEVKITHGNLTSSNVALDDEDNNTIPKIGDVGLPRLMTNLANTDAIATAGAQGYRAPEVSRMKNASPKSDVFSLGVIILELLTGKSPSKAIEEGQDLPTWVASIVKEEWTNEVFDVELMRDAASDVSDELLNTLKLALHCVDPLPGARPEAQDVVVKLEEIRANSGDDDDVPGRSSENLDR